MYALGGKRLTLRLVKYTGKSLWHVKVSVRQVWLVAEEISVSYGYLGENGYKKIRRLSYIPMQTQWVAWGLSCGLVTNPHIHVVCITPVPGW